MFKSSPTVYVTEGFSQLELNPVWELAWLVNGGHGWVAR